MKEKKSDALWYFGLLIRGAISLLMFIAVMILLAGRRTYWQGWVFGVILIATMIVSVALFSGKKDLARERTRPGPGIKWWDRLIFPAYSVLYLGSIILSVLDAGRFGWTGRLSPFVYGLSYTVYFTANAIFLWSMSVNRWFSSRVRIQSDRDQQVVRDGPYQWVRHPGYFGGVFMLICSPLILGSLWGLFPATLAILLLLIRTQLEDKVLLEELEGYEEYARNVPFKLLPGIW